MKIKSYTIEKCALFLVFLFYISTNAFWGYRLFHESNIFPAMASLLPIFLFIAFYFITGFHIRIPATILTLAIYAVTVIWSGFDPKMILFYGMCATMLMDSRISDTSDWLKWFYLFSLLFIVGSFINLFMPGLYRSMILPAFAGSKSYEKLLSWSRMGATLIIPGFTSQSGFNAPHFVYGIGYILSCRIVEKVGFKRWLIFGLLLVCLVLTNKRAHFLFGILSIAIAYYATGEKKYRSKRFLILVLSGIAGLIVVYFLITSVDVGVFRKLNLMLTQISDDEDVTSGRIELYAVAWKHFLQNPIFGIGWEQYPFLPDGLGEMHTHDIYLELLCETGIVGFTMFAAFFGYSLYTAFRNSRMAKSKEEKMSASFCLYMQLFFLLYGITGNPLYDPPYYIPYFLTCAFSMHRHFTGLMQREGT